jgi:hypothetical protein
LNTFSILWIILIVKGRFSPVNDSFAETVTIFIHD